jgi:UDP-hydrolysing UDP-N-acetyl-D-glucosamine 2-epimerase
VLTTRGNFAKMKTAMAAIREHPDLELRLAVGGALLNRQSAIVDEIKSDGFTIDATLDYMDVSETPEGIGSSAASCLRQATAMLAEMQPDVLMVIADRYESLALAQAALCTNVRIAHLEGGEQSGSIDERIRHAITKLAHYHFPSSKEAAERIERLGERPESIAAVGSPSFDLLRNDGEHGFRRLQERLAGQAIIDLERPFLLVSQHPVVTEYNDAQEQYRVLAECLIQLGLPSILIWPNNDAGSQAIQGPLELLKAHAQCPPLAVVAGLPIEEYGAALMRAACLVGNSSSGIREAAFLGTPVVNIGTRQMTRARSANVVDVPCDVAAITAAVRQQMAHGRYPPDQRYGNGTAGQQIAEFLASYWPPLDKVMAY